MGALAWEQEPPKTHSVSRSFFDRGVGSSILASLSEAGGNDQHSSLSKPLPPRSRTCVSRLPECVHVFLIVHAAGQSVARMASQDSLIFVDVRAYLSAPSRVRTAQKSCFGRLPSHLGNRTFPLEQISSFSFLNHRKWKMSSRMTTLTASQFRFKVVPPG
jgi:hypothetical protein